MEQPAKQTGAWDAHCFLLQPRAEH
jgi:hypothetical protein